MYYSHVEIKYVATSFSPVRTDLALKLLSAHLACELRFKVRTWPANSELRLQSAQVGHSQVHTLIAPLTA